MSAPGGRFAPTPEQAAVVGHRPEAPLVVEAAAGSGKTGTMAELFAARIAQGVVPGRLMAVTFTEKAAGELRERIAGAVTGALPPDRVARERIRLERGWIGTFHQLALRLLREHAYRAGISPQLELLDPIASRLLQGDVEAAILGGRPPGPGVPPYEPEGCLDLARLESWVEAAARAATAVRAREPHPVGLRRRAGAAYAQFADRGHPADEVAAHREALELTVAVWAGYEARLRALGAVDFDGLLRLALTALGPGTELRRWCRRHFDLVIVDEFQDTSELQVALLEAWAKPGWGNVVAVGDPRQAIYGWRDAAPDVMARVPGRRVVLDRNHRSRGPIIAATDRLIRVDPAFTESPPVVLHRSAEPGLPVRLGIAPDTATEARAIAAVLRCVTAGGLSHPDGQAQPLAFGDCAVLAYTMGRLQGPLEEALRALNIPYRTGSGLLFERPEVLDCLAYLRAASDPDDDAAWLRLAQGPIHRLSDAAILGLGPADRPLHERMRAARVAGGADGTDGVRIAHLLATVDRLATVARRLPPAQVVAMAIETTGLGRRHEALSRRGDPDGRRAVAALAELQRVCLTAQASGRVGGLAHLLQRLAALSTDERTPEPPPVADEDAVTILTVHRAKGLEFPFVILADSRPFRRTGAAPIVWDGQSGAVVVTRLGARPTRAAGQPAGDAVGAAERAERRRVWYVGMTRARDGLLVTTTQRGRGAAGGGSPEAIAAGLAAKARGPRPAAYDDDDLLVLVEAMAEGVGTVEPWPAFPDGPIAEADRLGPLPSPKSPGPAATELDVATLPVERWRRVVALEGVAERPGATGPAPVPASRPLSFTELAAVHRCPRRAAYRRLGLPPTDRAGGEAATEPEREAGERPGRAAEATGAPGAADAVGGRALGVAVHAALEAVHRQAPAAAPTAKALAAALAPWRQRLGARRHDEAVRLLAGYARLPVAGWPTGATELRFSWTPAGVANPQTVHGAIDRLARSPAGEDWILDYKTGRGPGPDPKGPAGHQLRLYAMAWRDGLAGHPVPLRAGIVDVRSGRLVPVPLAEPELQETRRWIATAAERLRDGSLAVGPGHPDRPCGGCPYRSACPERRTDAVEEAPPLLAG